MFTKYEQKDVEEQRVYREMGKSNEKENKEKNEGYIENISIK